MKAKTIKKILTQKHNDWVNSIDDQLLRSQVRNNTIITGGCIASMLMQEPVNDYDVYFTSRETVLRVCEYYVKQFQRLNYQKGTDSGHTSSEDAARHKIDILSEGGRVKLRIHNRDLRPAAEKDYQFDEGPEDVSEFDDVEPMLEDTSEDKLPKYRPVYLSANAITLSDKIQLVIRFFGDAETIHENYDFNHCKCYWTSGNKKLVLPSFALEALLTKELVYTGSKYPLASIIRTRKFINRGFTINAGQYLKMCLQLNKLDLSDIYILEDQLIGMDALYFAQMLAAIPDDKKIDGKVDEHYIMTLIDRFF